MNINLSYRVNCQGGEGRMERGRIARERRIEEGSREGRMEREMMNRERESGDGGEDGKGEGERVIERWKRER